MKKITPLLAIAFFGLITNQIAFADSHANAIADAVNNPARSDEDRKRDETSKPAEVLEFLGVKPGMRILDYLSGGGYYSEILSYAVGDKGEVVAHTNEAYKKFVGDAITKRFGEGRLPKVIRLSSEVPAMGLAKETFDMILMVMTYHDIYYVADYWPAVDRENWFAQIHSALKPGGILAIIDHSAVAGTGISAAQDLHRIDEEFSRKDIESAGFTFETSSDALRNPDDARTIGVFEDGMRRKTDRFVHRYVKK
ncbi:MAG: putative methyltransferase [Planctomycetota bacterium]|jgi:predicted methyltransferase